MELLPLELQFQIYEQLHRQLLREVHHELTSVVKLAEPKRGGRLQKEHGRWKRGMNLDIYEGPDWGGYCTNFIYTAMLANNHCYRNAMLLRNYFHISPSHHLQPEVQPCRTVT
jgi:hypothetical protein